MNRLPWFIYILFTLAIVGLVSALIRNPSNFLLSILIAVAIGAILYFVLTTFINRGASGSSNEMRKYRQAVKQSKLKYNPKDPSIQRMKRTTSSTTRPRPRKRKRYAPHLTVIDGKKSTSKKNSDRASN